MAESSLLWALRLELELRGYRASGFQGIQGCLGSAVKASGFCGFSISRLQDVFAEGSRAEHCATECKIEADNNRSLLTHLARYQVANCRNYMTRYAQCDTLEHDLTLRNTIYCSLALKEKLWHNMLRASTQQQNGAWKAPNSHGSLETKAPANKG